MGDDHGDTYRSWKLEVVKLLNAGAAHPRDFFSWRNSRGKRPSSSESQVLPDVKLGHVDPIQDRNTVI